VYEDKSICLFSHYLNDDSLVALAVELGVEDLLPGAKVEFAIGHRDDHFMVNDERLQMRVSIVFPGLVVLVILAERSERFEPLVDVFDKPALVVVDVDSSGDVHGRDENHAVFDSRLFQRALYLRRQVNVGALGFRVQGQVFGVEFHASILTRGLGWKGTVRSPTMFGGGPICWLSRKIVLLSGAKDLLFAGSEHTYVVPF
jgi:hypothetical protein